MIATALKPIRKRRQIRARRCTFKNAYTRFFTRVQGPGLYNGYYASWFGIDPYGNYTLHDSYASLVKKKVKPANGTTTTYVTVSNVALTTYHYSDQQLFDEWYALEKAKKGWWKNLPKCPCKLSKKRRVNYKCVETKDGVIIEESWETEHSKSGEPFNPDSQKWDDPKVPSGAEAALHPGAAYSMRSKGVRGRYNQCIYDKNLKLITTAPGAGTVDYYKAGTMDHYNHDVEPVVLANHLDGGNKPGFVGVIRGKTKMVVPAGKNTKKYYDVRPSWHESCKKNP